jgi:hypothetical protein
MAVDVALAIAFVEENGAELDKARLRRLLSGVDLDSALVRSFLGPQNEDGGFPCRRVEGNPSCIHSTLNALWRLDELEMLGTPPAEDALSYLLEVQRDDGGWDEDESVIEYGVPPWAVPGDLRARLYLSALSTYWLVAGGCAEDPALERAFDFLLAHQDEMGRFHGFLHSTWIGTGALLMAGERYSEAAQKGLQALADEPISEWVDSQICWALDCLGRAGLPQDHPFVVDCLDQLARRQRDGGGWASEDGQDHAVGATIEAVKVFMRYGLLDVG